ncbi:MULTISPECIES: bifunctional 4-hydroxy-2-oxoglutarate aldolase/2-dehydro-3-deoxy-phosphogluconate aldolase [Nocardiopsis]|uniref:KDPG and KHG aldolase n=1 Tax=Nocardiopsis dassonvillei (strain ATCC 23218 / DSM 43111 / CIP 107115 / JCM 7437 / KCTC 9190 / NBRC 14626 / NCTC 10488 / NRRL B-5397 / IMRU 509) TaxID=446468 RepID=D7B387_NOCDD|nr:MULTISPECIES: bifunctional 4-hydroxy-2-oxoglutarate aldolase/2-dehydro-3-deoxy-phosphogluconate aldolase [Nocardiopsis]ADH66815.1 KDPG and KHG aldolase [Nocardiopsis dassonvillei subsp. dassonvillei DSM 43111]NKY80018.1 bifunctional 4-hydroxy-2-oxoglutarate aldolase/2-dehydro-3-deoxy-phosphogluconate aldolase [Nocardiopsis dassonvillei]VEI86487.1 2-dehydro-3-deoxy-6-phosphogalactonate aldolase [Nocardiopsis dassonvillei]
MSDQGLDGLFGGHRVLAILRGMPVDTTVELAERAWDLGVTAVEVPARDAQGLEALRATVRAGAERGHPVGAGTVITPEQVRDVADAGAAFTVAPGFDAEVMAASEAAGMPHLPGVATPSDIQGVIRAGGRWVKAFPATSLGTAWFRAMHGPFPELRIVATGGMDARNAREYLDAGARMVAVGSALADPEQIPLLAELV